MLPHPAAAAPTSTRRPHPPPAASATVPHALLHPPGGSTSGLGFSDGVAGRRGCVLPWRALPEERGEAESPGALWWGHALSLGPATPGRAHPAYPSPPPYPPTHTHPYTPTHLCTLHPYTPYPIHPHLPTPPPLAFLHRRWATPSHLTPPRTTFGAHTCARARRPPEETSSESVRLWAAVLLARSNWRRGEGGLGVGGVEGEGAPPCARALDDSRFPSLPQPRIHCSPLWTTLAFATPHLIGVALLPPCTPPFPPPALALLPCTTPQPPPLAE